MIGTVVLSISAQFKLFQKMNSTALQLLTVFVCLPRGVCYLPPETKYFVTAVSSLPRIKATKT